MLSILFPSTNLLKTQTTLWMSSKQFRWNGCFRKVCVIVENNVPRKMHELHRNYWAHTAFQMIQRGNCWYLHASEILTTLQHTSDDICTLYSNIQDVIVVQWYAYICVRNKFTENTDDTLYSIAIPQARYVWIIHRGKFIIEQHIFATINCPRRNLTFIANIPDRIIRSHQPIDQVFVETTQHFSTLLTLFETNVYYTNKWQN